MKTETASWTNESFLEDAGGKLVVFFHAQQVPHNHRTKIENRPVFVEKIFITKIVPGDNKLIIDRPMRMEDMEEFPREWALWEQKRQNIVPGTPIESWSILSDTQKAEFKALNIYTIEQFANLPDSNASKIMGFNDLRVKAKAFLSAAQDAELMAKLREETDAKLASQEAEIERLRAMVMDMDKKRGPGRPRKTETAEEEIPA
jgi:hypothetical protein